MIDQKIVVHAKGVQVRDLEIPRKDVADFLESMPEEERETTFIRAVEVGVFCLERARTSQDTEFVRRQVESLLGQVERATGTIPHEIEKALVAKIGTGDGQVLAPINSAVSLISKTLTERVKEVKDLLAQEMDPGKETTTLGKALRSLRDIFDPKRTDSVQGVVDAAVSRVTAEDGSLAKAVKAVVADAVKPLANEVSELAKEIRGQEAAAEALEQTTAKGAPYEDEIVTALQAWAQTTGAEVHHVGIDNRPGDVLVKIGATSLTQTPVTFVVEARDRQSRAGRKTISDALTTAMVERQADAAVYVSRSGDGLAKEIGEWAEGESERGPWVACTNDHLITAFRFLIVQERLKHLRASAPEVDAGSIMTQLQRIRTTLDRVKTINRRVTDVHNGADAIKAEAETLREEVRDALTTIEDSLRGTAGEVNASDAA